MPVSLCLIRLMITLAYSLCIGSMLGALIHIHLERPDNKRACLSIELYSCKVSQPNALIVQSLFSTERAGFGARLR